MNEDIKQGKRLQEGTVEERRHEKKKKRKKHHKRSKHHHHHDHHHHKKSHVDEASLATIQAANTTTETIESHSDNEGVSTASFAQLSPWHNQSEEMQARRPTKTIPLVTVNESKSDEIEGSNVDAAAAAVPSEAVNNTAHNNRSAYNVSMSQQEQQDEHPATYAVQEGNETQVYPGILSPSPSADSTSSAPSSPRTQQQPSAIADPTRLFSATPVDPDEDRRILREELRNVLTEQQAAAAAVAPPIVQAVAAVENENAGGGHGFWNKTRLIVCGGVVMFLLLAGLAVGLVFAFVWKDDDDSPSAPPTIAPTSFGWPTSPPTTVPPLPEPTFAPSPLPTTPLPTLVLLPPPTISPTPPPTVPPSPFPTAFPTPFPTALPTLPPVSVPPDLIDLISSVSFDNGNALRIQDTPQNQAINWLAGNANLDLYTDDRKIQRYALATIYYSTDGATWDPLGFWLTDGRECSWGNYFSCENESIILFQQNSGFMRGMIPNEIALLSNLENLDLSGNGLTGVIPRTIGELTKLTLLDFSRCNLSGPIPTFIGRLTSLTRISVSMNSLMGQIPSEIGLLTNLVDSSYHSNFLTGSIPTSIGQMTSLQTFEVYVNSLTGPVPVSISQIPLTSMRLYENMLTGTIPVGITSMEQLKELRLDVNQLTGTIPPEISGMTNLDELHLYNNSFTGSYECPGFITDCFVSCKTAGDPSCRSL